MPTTDERGIVSKSKLTALAAKIKTAAGESGSFTLDELAALDISGGGSGETIMLSATFDAGENKIFTTDTLDDLKQYLTVTATVNTTPYALADDAYSLSGSLSAGANTITVSALGHTATFTVSGVIAAVDITPASVSITGTASNTQYGVVDNAVNVWNTSNGTYKSAYYALTLESGVRYRLTADVEVHNLTTTVCVGLANHSSGSIILRSPTSTSSGRLVADGVGSDSSNFSTDGRVSFFATFTTSAPGCATYKNFKIIKYQEVS